MNKEFIPYEQALELKELGFDEYVIAYWEKNSLLKPIPMSDAINSFPVNDYPKADWIAAPLYQQAFRFFREKYKFTYSIGNTNIAVIHYLGTTQLLQNNESYEAAELATIKWFIDVAKQQ